jgi:hypothetical protein
MHEQLAELCDREDDTPQNAPPKLL